MAWLKHPVLIHQRNAGFLNGHRDRAPELQTAHAANGLRKIGRAKRLCRDNYIQRFVQIVVKACTEVTWACRQGHADLSASY